MIKINLLPVRAARRKENIRRQVSIFFLCVVFGLCLMVYFVFSMNHKISVMKEEIEVVQAELNKYEAKAKEAKKIKNALKKLEDKMDVIVKLEANRTGPVRFMDALTNLVMPEKMWLTSVSEKQRVLSLKGNAADNKVIADFMTSLEKSPHFNQVDLISSKQIGIEKNRKYKEFSITCNLADATSEKKPKKS